MPQLSCPPLSARNALREHKLAHSGYSVLLCHALLSFYKISPFVHNPACDEAFICRLHLESSLTCQTLLGLEAASKSKHELVSPMFKGMEGQSLHVIGIIKKGYNPTQHFDSIFSHQLSWSFGVLLAFSNSVFACRSMHMRTLIGHWLQGNLHAEHFLLVT